MEKMADGGKSEARSDPHPHPHPDRDRKAWLLVLVDVGPNKGQDGLTDTDRIIEVLPGILLASTAIVRRWKESQEETKIISLKGPTAAVKALEEACKTILPAVEVEVSQEKPPKRPDPKTTGVVVLSIHPSESLSESGSKLLRRCESLGFEWVLSYVPPEVWAGGVRRKNER